MSQERFLVRAAKTADLVLGASGGACLLLSLYLFYRSGWSGQQRLASPAGLLVYYLVPALLGCLLLATLKLRPNRRINLVIACLSVGVSVYGLEIFLAISKPVAPMVKGAPLLHFPPSATNEERQRVKSYIKSRFGVDADVRPFIEVITGLRRQGIDAVPSIIPRLLLEKEPGGTRNSPLSVNGQEVITLSGVADRITVLCNESGQYVTYRSDRHGLRNPREVWESDRVEVAALGDSFTQGYCVPGDKNFVDLIRKHHPAILNLGMAGNGPLMMLATFEEYAARFKPKVVLWFYFEGNDLLDLQEEQSSPLLVQYLKAGFNQKLAVRKADIDRELLTYLERETAKESKRQAVRKSNRFGEWLKAAKLSDLREKLGLVYGNEADEASELAKLQSDTLNQFRQVLALANQRTSEWGGRLHFVYLPNWPRYTGNLRPHEQMRDKVLEIVRGMGIPVIDIHPAFESHGDPMSLFPFSAPGHYNEEGHRVVAETVLKSIALDD